MSERTARDEGMEAAADSNAELLECARDIANFVYKGVPISIEDVRRGFVQCKVPFRSGNWMGSVFKQKDIWEPVGWAPTQHAGGHRRYVRQWRKKV